MNNFKIKRIKGLNDSEVSFCANRGGIITSLKLKGKDILYIDKDTFNDENLSVRGGIPVLFPNAGELINNSIYPNLKRHGFARDLPWIIEESKLGFKEKLFSSSETKKIFPYDFEVVVIGGFENNDSFNLNIEVKNLEKDVDMPISSGLHPYFNVKDKNKKDIKFNFVGGKEIEEKIDIWQKGGTVYVDNPKIKFPNNDIEVFIPGLGKIILDISVEYQKIWVWSQPDKDFICIEPMMRSENGLIGNPFLVKEGSTIKTFLKISLI